MAFNETLPLEGLRPAEYNPRQIEQAAVDQLIASITELGFIKPVVVREDGLIIAGHQRTRAALALGMTTVPGHVLKIQGIADEIRFNQLHNGCEIDLYDTVATVAQGNAGTWRVLRDADVADRLGNGAAERQEMLRLLAKYGPFGGCVALPSGELVAGQSYAWCCVRSGQPIHVRYVDQSAAELVKEHLAREYGRYSYSHLPKTTWAQCLAQMNRLEGSGNLKSTLYERCVLPNLPTGARILDFGCGKGAYVRQLQRDGYSAFGVEFYVRSGFDIDVRKVNASIDLLLNEIRSRGRFDVIVCDSVLNSVDSLQAEADVLGCINALCKPGGQLYFSGRPIERVQSLGNCQTLRDGTRRYIEFLDEDGFTAMYRHGNWHYQKFHSREDVERLARQYVGQEFKLTCSDRATVPRAGLTGTSWQVQGLKCVEISREEQEAALAREFDLPIPSGTYGRGQEAVDAFRAALSLES